jgi:hypothetical protein
MMDTRKAITMAVKIYLILVKITQRTIVHGTAMAVRMAKLSTTMPIVGSNRRAVATVRLTANQTLTSLSTT